MLQASSFSIIADVYLGKKKLTRVPEFLALAKLLLSTNEGVHFSRNWRFVQRKRKP